MGHVRQARGPSAAARQARGPSAAARLAISLPLNPILRRVNLKDNFGSEWKRMSRIPATLSTKRVIYEMMITLS